jgi:putative transferase (TIGR04331 family)
MKKEYNSNLNDNLYAIVSECKNKREISIFPSKDNGDEYVIPLEKLDELFKSHLTICDQVSHKMAKIYIELFACSYNQAINVIRCTLTPILLLLLDRIYRINKTVELNTCSLATYKKSMRKRSYTESEIVNFSGHNVEFNNYLIYRLGKIWSLPVIANKEKKRNNKHIERKKPISNTSRIYSKFSIDAIIVRFNMFLSKIISIFKNKDKRIPVLALQRNELSFIRFGFYLKYISEVKWKKDSINKGNIDKLLRKKIISIDVLDSFGMDNFLTKIGVNKEKSKIIIRDIIFDFYNIESLENFKKNNEISESLMKKYTNKYFIFSGIPNLYHNYLISSALEKGKTVIGMQHGGGYGYFKNRIVHLLEYRISDGYISYGWKLLSNQYGNNIKIVPLPVPWLSEKRKYWKSYTYDKKKKYDVLFLCRKVFRFPTGMHGQLPIMSDAIKITSDVTNKILTTLVKNKIKVLHKPQNKEKINLIDGVIAKIQEFDGDYYSLISEPDKGFSKDLISKSNIVLWDFPSTGIMECFAGRIPTMMYWGKEIDNKILYEGEWNDAYFANLERVGVIHSCENSLVTEINNFKRSPSEWMSDKDRVSAIDDFLMEYCRISSNWKKDWKKFFREIEEVF